MKNLLAFLLFTSTYLFAQSPQSPINIIRYNDNFNYVKKDSVKKGLDILKHISLSKNANISFGGELREQYQHFGNSNFGDAPPTFKSTTFNQVWHRIMAHSNIEIGSKTRIFLQLNSTYRFFNENPLTPQIDENRLSLHQAFIDYKFNDNWAIRLGRQEMGYGNNRLITFREGPNTRLTFDAAIVKFANSKRKIDFLAISPVISIPYAFDDELFKEYVFGIYANEKIIDKKLLLDYYGLHFMSDRRKYNFASGKEQRQTFGFRLFSQNARFNYEVETNLQTGTFDTKNILAYGFSSDLNYVLNVKSKFTLGIVTNYFTGDQDNLDDKLNTYNPIFAKPSYGLAAPIGSSNIININPYVRINPLEKLTVYSGVYFMQRQSVFDGTYSPAMAQVRLSPSNLFVSNEKAIGKQYALELNYQYNNNLSFASDFAYFDSGKYVNETGKGKNITYFSLKTAYKF
jgi:hypothetical protein